MILSVEFNFSKIACKTVGMTSLFPCDWTALSGRVLPRSHRPEWSVEACLIEGH